MKIFTRLAAIALTLFAVHVSAFAAPTTVTFNIDEEYEKLFGLDGPITTTQTYLQDGKMTKDGVTISIKMNTSKYGYSLSYNSLSEPHVRLQLQKGLQIQITAPQGKKLHKMIITSPSEWEYNNTFSRGDFYYNSLEWLDNSAKSQTLTIDINGTTYLSLFAIELVDDSYVPAPEISMESGNYVNAFKTAINFADSITPPAGTRILYTTDGSIPSQSRTAKVYSDSIEITKETMLRAVAQSMEGDYSEEVSATYAVASAHVVNSIAELKAQPLGSYCTFHAKNVKVIRAYYNRLGSLDEAYLQDGTDAIRVVQLTEPGNLANIHDGSLVSGTILGQYNLYSEHTPTLRLVTGNDSIVITDGETVKPVAVKQSELESYVNRYVSVNFRRSSTMQINSQLADNFVYTGYDNALMHVSGVVLWAGNTISIQPFTPDSVQILFDEDSTNVTNSVSASRNIHVVINKKFTAGKWTPFVTPITISNLAARNLFGDDVQVDTLATSDANKISFKKYTGELTAGTPYLIKTSRDINSVKLDSVGMRRNDVVQTVKKGTNSAVGILSPTALKADGKTYYIADGVLKKADADAKQKGLSFYLTTDATDVNPVLEIDGVTDAINGVSVRGSQATGNDAIYTLGGVRLQQLQKGLNIVRKADGTISKVLVR